MFPPELLSAVITNTLCTSLFAVSVSLNKNPVVVKDVSDLAI